MRFQFYFFVLITIAFLSCNKNDSGNSQTNVRDSLKIGLIAYYPLDDTKDKSGNNYDLQNSNAKPTKDRFGNDNTAYYFNGVNSELIIPSIPKANSLKDFTIAYWLKMDTLNDSYIMSFVSNPATICDLSNGIRIMKDSYENYISENEVLTKDTTNSCSRLQMPFYSINPIGNWVHFVLIQKYIDTGITSPSYLFYNYINGISSRPYNSQGASAYERPVTFEYGGALGCYRFYEGVRILDIQFMKGSIDDVRLYNRALSANEVNELYSLTE